MSPKTQLAARYQDVLNGVFSRIVETQALALTTAGTWVADRVASGNLIYTLGSGHSLLIAAELYYRAGGLANFDVIHDRTFGRAERLPGYAKALLDSYPISNRDLLIVVSNSGRNELPVEMALEARKRDIRSIAITSLAHSLSAPPRTVSGLRLSDAVDLVIDNCGVPGDASLELSSPKGSISVGPTSTAAGIFIANSIVSIATEKLIEKGCDPPVFVSANVEIGDTKNRLLLDFLRERIRGL